MSHETRVRVPPDDDATLLARIRHFIADAADKPLEEVGPDTDIYTELALDSLGAVAVFIDMAYEFGVPEPENDTDFPLLNNANKLLEYVRAKCPRTVRAG